MSDTRPAPYPADTAAKGWRFQLDHERIRRSDTWALAPAALRPWLLMLWMVAWEQVPCGSLPDSDELIAARIGMNLAAFQASRRTLMRGWWRAEDGRLYHDTITDQVKGMMEAKEGERRRKAEYRERRAAGRAAALSHGCPTGQTRDSTRTDGGRDATGTGTIYTENSQEGGASVDNSASRANVTRDSGATHVGLTPESSTGTGTVYTENSPQRARPVDHFHGLGEGSEPDLSGHEPTPEGLAAQRLRDAGVLQAAPNAALRGVLARGLSVDDLVKLAPAALKPEVAEPFAYLLKCAENALKPKVEGTATRSPATASSAAVPDVVQSAALLASLSITPERKAEARRGAMQARALLRRRTPCN